MNIIWKIAWNNGNDSNLVDRIFRRNCINLSYFNFIEEKRDSKFISFPHFNPKDKSDDFEKPCLYEIVCYGFLTIHIYGQS